MNKDRSDNPYASPQRADTEKSASETSGKTSADKLLIIGNAVFWGLGFVSCVSAFAVGPVAIVFFYVSAITGFCLSCAGTLRAQGKQPVVTVLGYISSAIMGLIILWITFLLIGAIR